MKMISVKTALPSELGTYLVYDKQNEKYFRAEYSFSPDNKGRCFFNYAEIGNTVDYWCELPELEEEPKQELKMLITDEEFLLMKEATEIWLAKLRELDADYTREDERRKAAIAILASWRLAQHKRK